MSGSRARADQRIKTGEANTARTLHTPEGVSRAEQAGDGDRSSRTHLDQSISKLEVLSRVIKSALLRLKERTTQQRL
jgi:hypothetical protein